MSPLADAVGFVDGKKRNVDGLEKLTREVAENQGLKAAALIHPLRYAVSGEKVTPGLFELMSVLEKDKCLERVQRFLC